jgi:STE24 endopeptidase
MSEITIDPQRQEQAKQYARLSRRLMLVDLVIGGFYLLAWLLAGWSMTLQENIYTWTGNAWLQVAAFAMIFGGIYYLINLPLSFYSGFRLPKRFGMSSQTFGGWVSDQIKSLVISVVLGGFLIEVIYAVLRLSPEWWWLWVAGIMLAFTVLLANLAPVLLMPVFYKFVPLGDEHADLVERLMQLAKAAHTHVQGVFKFDLSRRTKAANAALTGLGNTRRIILGDTLLDEFTPDEIETVLAHELGHHVHKDIPVGIVLESGMTLVGLYIASLGLSWGVKYFGFSSSADVAAMPLLILVLGIYGLVTMPLGNAFSRWRERRADQYALHATGNGPAYASALARLANQNLADVDPEPWVEFLLYSHPALKKRISMAQSYHTAPSSASR